LGLPELNSIYFRYFLSFYQVLRAKELLMTGIGRTRRIKSKSSECGKSLRVGSYGFILYILYIPVKKKVKTLWLLVERSR